MSKEPKTNVNNVIDTAAFFKQKTRSLLLLDKNIFSAEFYRL